MDIGKNINWSNDLERYLADMGERAYCYSYLNKKAEERYSRLRTFIDLPVIIGSTISGVLSVGSSGLFQNNEQLASMSIGALSLFVGVINTVGTYFAWAKRAENHRISSITYGKLYRFISIELGLPRSERMGAGDLLKVCRENYERLQEIAPLIPDDIVRGFKKRFNVERYAEISKPSECNGLEPVTIFKEEDGKEKEIVEKIIYKVIHSNEIENLHAEEEDDRVTIGTDDEENTSENVVISIPQERSNN